MHRHTQCMQVVIDKAGEGGFGSIGRTRGDAPDIDCLVYFAQTLPPGTYVQVRMHSACVCICTPHVVCSHVVCVCVCIYIYIYTYIYMHG